MTKKLLVYNMPKDYLDRIKKFEDKYKFTIIEANQDHLGQNVGNILEDKLDASIDSSHLDHIDINFIMIHNFENDELDEFLKDMRGEKLSLPNKCISTETNKTWILHELLKENKEEAELMPILHGMYQVRKVAENLLEEDYKGQKDLEDVVENITAYIKTKEFEKEAMKEIYNNSVRVVNKYLEK